MLKWQIHFQLKTKGCMFFTTARTCRQVQQHLPQKQKQLNAAEKSKWCVRIIVETHQVSCMLQWTKCIRLSSLACQSVCCITNTTQVQWSCEQIAIVQLRNKIYVHPKKQTNMWSKCCCWLPGHTMTLLFSCHSMMCVIIKPSKPLLISMVVRIRKKFKSHTLIPWKKGEAMTLMHATGLLVNNRQHAFFPELFDAELRTQSSVSNGRIQRPAVS